MTSLSRTLIATACAALLSANASLPSQAANQLVRRGASPYDGAWSVVIQTARGDCPGAIRAGVRIFGGRVLSNDPGYSVEGRVAANGALRVNVSAGGQGAGGFGRLWRTAGRGLWRAWSGQCSGQWTAARREQFDYSQ
jgi:hypothetical protein